MHPNTRGHRSPEAAFLFQEHPHHIVLEGGTIFSERARMRPNRKAGGDPCVVDSPGTFFCTKSKHAEVVMQTLKLVKTGVVQENAPQYTSPAKVYLDFRRMAKLDREHFIVLHLDGKSRILAKETVSIGSLNSAIVTPREVFKAAIYNNSAALILLHNHPSGDPTPSPADLEVTERLVEAGNLIGIEILDHVIIGNYDYYSVIHKNHEKLPAAFFQVLDELEADQCPRPKTDRPARRRANKRTLPDLKGGQGTS